jgi:hypothetical protein
MLSYYIKFKKIKIKVIELNEAKAKIIHLWNQSEKL